ncbi:ABC transporter substrate-binding protein [Melaminivora alkalimesophila]|uniref:Iron complex transport system substrate-binding protein n=1 Tax=Melaminivora alkalimesophila TaxID=1165852 RepID=A0A317RAS4_9BURK|nr:helical backbone metal receptor [Melaminivora alkalimesophila]PWW46255.1 iron complex transport system substrate-binding protein [Melaminivora alkalimesophila]
MKDFFLRIVRAAWAGLLLASASLAAAAAIQITDDRGRTLRFDEPPRRVVSLLPSSTESLCEMEQCARLVGVDRYSNWPDSVQRLPKVGGGIDPNIEAIVALRPDVVLLSVSSRVSDRLEALGLKVVALEPKTHADVRRVLRLIGELFAVPPEQGADRLWRVIDAAVQAAAQSLPPQARGARVYFEVSRGPYAAGQPSFIGETLARLGVRNVVPAELGPFPRLSPEYVLRAQPDLVMVSNRNGQPLALYPGWQNLSAVKAGRLCVFGPEPSDILVRPGPRMAEAARIMARCLSEKFATP